MGMVEIYSTLFGSTSQEMDPTIWRCLPSELLDHILSFLPLKSLLNLRLTCKHFKTLIYSPSFICKHSSSSSSPFSAFLLLSHPQFHRQYPLYGTVLNTWKNFSFSLSSLIPSAPSGTTLQSVSNGLLCFSLPRWNSFLIYSLLSRSSSVINFPTCPCDFELLTLVSNSDGYKIFLVSSCGSSVGTYIFDSTMNLWRRFKNFDPVFSILSDNYHQEGVLYNGYLCFTTTEPFYIVCLHLETGKWERSIIELPKENEHTFVRLINNGAGSLYLLGGIGSNGISRSIKLWELSKDGEEWVEVGSPPEMICKKFLSVCYHKYEHVYCFWHQGLVCVCCHIWPEVLYYNVSRRTWHWLPKSPLLSEKWSCGFKWFSFVPNLYALV